MSLSILVEIGITNESMEIINRMNYRNLFFIRLNIYKSLVYEFYNSLKLGIDVEHHIMDFTMKFRLSDQDYTVTSQMLTQWLQCDDNRMLNTLENFNHSIAWIQLRGQETYNSHLSKSRKLDNPVYKVLHRMIAYTWNV